MRGILDVLAEQLAGEGSILSEHVGATDARAALGSLAASGPRTAADARAYALVVESVREGYLLHYGEPRLLAGLDPDLALLAGDYLYARGLERLAALGDLESVRELSDLISLLAQLHAGGEPETRETATAWLAAAVAVAAGGDPEGQAAKGELRRSGNGKPLYAWARERAAAAGLSERFAEVAEAVGFRSADRG